MSAGLPRGSNYLIGDTFTILGSKLGGVDGLSQFSGNDLVITVASVGVDNAVSTVTHLGTSSAIYYDLSGTDAGVTETVVSGSGVEYTVTNDGALGYTITLVEKGSKYTKGDTFTISGSKLGGVDGPDHLNGNDLVITVDTVLSSADAGVGNIVQNGTSSVISFNLNETDAGVTETVHSGSGVAYKVINTGGGNYSVNVVGVGSNYTKNDMFTISGSELGGVDGPSNLMGNDLTIVVQSVSTSGVITDIAMYPSTSSVIPFNLSDIDHGVTENVVSGSGVEYKVTNNGINGYGLETTVSGSNYLIGDTLTISGSSVGGVDGPYPGGNDLVITVGSVGVNNCVDTFSQLGTPSKISFDLSGTSENVVENVGTSGSGATFTITNTSGHIYKCDISNNGSNYRKGDTILLDGNNIGGTTSTNDLTLTVSNVSGETITGVTISGYSIAVNSVLLDGSHPDIIELSTIGNGSASMTIVNNPKQNYYTLTFNNSGDGYAIGDHIIVPGNLLGGINNINDCKMTVATVAPNGAITSYNTEGTVAPRILTSKIIMLHQGSSGTNNISKNANDIINSVEVLIGGQMIDKHYGDWLNIWAQLTTPIGKNDGLNNMLDLKSGIYSYIPLQFWFNRNPGLALPLIALQYHEVKIKIEFAQEGVATGACGGSCEQNPAATDWSEAKLFIDYVYLDNEERRRFASSTHEYLIDQLQFSGVRILPKDCKNLLEKINFNHPVKELIWRGDTIVKDGDEAITGGESTEYRDGDSNKCIHMQWDEITLLLNGHERFAPRHSEYFRLIQPFDHHTQVPTRSGIHVYSFALKPEEHQPSGTCNFSRIDTATLKLFGGTVSSNNGSDGDGNVFEPTLRIYATNYNVLRIMNGMGGVAYSL